jgi:mono/diheme cytochrome c family protein
MRYFVLAFLLFAFVVVSVAGCRGSFSRRPPIELFADMDRQPKLRPQAANRFFANGLSSRLPVPGTIARGAPYQDLPVNTGREPGTTNFVTLLPVPVTGGLMARGQERYTIYCSMCHGAAGDGKGITAKYQLVGVASFHDARLVAMTDGEIFNTITHGKNLMGAYGSTVNPHDRWAIIAYLRALQRTQLATFEDVPAPARASLDK